jgi:hypothetical protein
VVIAKKYYRRSLLPILLSSNHHLHTFSQVESSFDERIDENNNLDVFEMVAITIKFARKLVNLELLIFSKVLCLCEIYQMPFGVVEET